MTTTKGSPPARSMKLDEPIEIRIGRPVRLYGVTARGAEALDALDVAALLDEEG